ncbi:AAA family ATPase, partial [Acinetobacter baumannii]
HNMGYEVLIIDSASHEWIGTGGCLEINDEAAKRFKGNTWSAWSETTPRHRKFIDAILQTDMHIITTTRAKTETVQGEKGKVIKLGMKAEQREGYEYELTVSLDMLHENKFA